MSDQFNDDTNWELIVEIGRKFPKWTYLKYSQNSFLI